MFFVVRRVSGSSKPFTFSSADTVCCFGSSVPPPSETRLMPRAFVFRRCTVHGHHHHHHNDNNTQRQPVLFLAAAAVAAIAALLATRLASLDDLALALGLGAPMPPLSPIPVPFKFAAGKYKGSVTHHIRLQGEHAG